MKKTSFKTGEAVRYKPGFGTYGYEDCLEADGRVPAMVIGFSKTRVRIQFLAGRIAQTARCVDAASLLRVSEATLRPPQEPT